VLVRHGAERARPSKKSDRKISAAACRIGEMPFVVVVEAVVGTARN
jgi:hypothetical protein